MSATDGMLPEPLQVVVRMVADTWAFRPVVITLRWVWLFYRELQKDRAFMRAAGMAYATLIALVPMLVLVFGMLGAFGARQGSATEVAHALIDQVIGDVPTVQEVLLPGLLAVDLGALGAIAVAGLLLTAGRLYLSVEYAYCEIFGVPVRRTLLERILTFYFTITAIPVIMVTTVSTTWQFASDMGIHGALQFLSMGMTFAVLLAALKSFPATTVSWRAATVGATVSFVLLELGRKAFSLYLQMVVAADPLQAVYGSLGLIPIFLLWMYMFWVFVLLGVEVAFVLQNYTSLVEAERDARAREEDRFPQVADALYVSAWIAAAFMEGEGPQTFEQIARRTGMERSVLQAVLRVLARADVLVETPEGWLLCRPPEGLSLTELARLWGRATRFPASRPNVVRDELVKAVLLDGSLADGARRWVPRGDLPRPVA